jgi:hypothetical protein
VETNPRGLLRRLPARHVANVARWNPGCGNPVTWPVQGYVVTHSSTGAGPYAITSAGRFAYTNKQGGTQLFAFSATGAKLGGHPGTLLCISGKVLAGGSSSTAWVVQFTFPSTCSVLPGTQFATAYVDFSSPQCTPTPGSCPNVVDLNPQR